MNREQIHAAIERLKEQGTHYVKSQDVADELGKDVSQGKLSYIGAVLSDRDDIEKWGKGSKNMTWHIRRDV